jgi:hypothetical protein
MITHKPTNAAKQKHKARSCWRALMPSLFIEHYALVHIETLMIALIG